MDLFDTATLNTLRDGKPRRFQEILAAVKFSHNALRQYLDPLLDQSIVTGDKRPTEGRGRPRYAYSVPAGRGRAPAVIPNPSAGVVSLSFSGLIRFSRFGKGGFCKKVGASVVLRFAPD